MVLTASGRWLQALRNQEDEQEDRRQHYPGLEQALAYAQGRADRSRVKVLVFVRETPTPRKAGKRMPPLHPGEMLREDFLNPLGMTAEMLAREIKVPSGGWLLS